MSRRLRKTKLTPKFKNNFPKAVLVMNTPYDIVWEDDRENYGECDDAAQEIMISNYQTEAQADHTLLHEYIHAALATSGLDELLTEELNEAVTKCLTSAFLQITDIRKTEIKLK